ncbi:hypothetical protein [Methyloversatilis thermotolerans]|uniref:hypothetical protein n=1 Tax=Methyloversatilis thermotolerans TaxID=1346290 RepID=UPI0003798E88|nr:hypothetical protein [Methyloversatilis thermotolerans]
MFHHSMRMLLVAASVSTSAWAADPADPAAPTRPVDHRSVFDSYRATGAATVGNWRDANDAVGRQTGGHGHDHGSRATLSSDPHAGHDPAEQAAADAHAGHGAAGGDAKPHHCPHHAAHHESMHGHERGGGSQAMKSHHGHDCHHGDEEGGDAHKH